MGNFVGSNVVCKIRQRSWNTNTINFTCTVNRSSLIYVFRLCLHGFVGMFATVDEGDPVAVYCRFGWIQEGLRLTWLGFQQGSQRLDDRTLKR